jgi:hypothetical protein
MYPYSKRYYEHFIAGTVIMVISFIIWLISKLFKFVSFFLSH